MDAVPCNKPEAVCLTINLTDNGEVQTSVSNNINIQTTLTLLFTSMLGVMNSTLAAVLEHGPKDVNETDVRGEIYDMVNCGASAVLDQWMPDAANKADELTAAAILRAENELLEEADADVPLNNITQLFPQKEADAE